ncbi:hypothetical protein 2 [Beihai picorna-like virus 42]|uniref:hypothetical protein 2 n=1 Tax=Beihai picorna-like virus 42 TaxID=1922586 RepID=UPI000909B7C8|nr:hypothetical protein 2 [Beihai picorna-like virus 42]APG78021.1 hypothetical protein 2 [Beihai picorna-like virus 42]
MDVSSSTLAQNHPPYMVNNLFLPMADFHTSVENVVSDESHVRLASTFDETYNQGEAEDDNITQFLERPVEIDSFFWSVTGSVDSTIDPWDLFLSNPAVAAKLENYCMLRANMKLTFMINGTPQHAGILMVSYSYFGQDRHGSNALSQLIHRSQKPRVFINASTSKGACLEVPFFWPENFLNIPNNGSRTFTPGLLHMNSLSNLTQLAGGTERVTVTVFAALSDVTLAAPTAHLPTGKMKVTKIPREKSEYSMNGPVSSIASAVADAAGKLADTPVIGKFALATSIGARAAGSIASLFGFSKPADVNDIMRVRNTPMDGMAVSDGAEAVQKLTVTRKQEITIDPTTTGLSDASDTMSLDMMKKIESYFTTFQWGVVTAPKTYIFSVPVTPTLNALGPAPSGNERFPTLLHYYSRPFKFWCGTIKYRFKIIASQFTRGRLAIVYEPQNTLRIEDGGSPLDPFNTNFCVIVDIAETRDFTVEIPWYSEQPYLPLYGDDVTNIWKSDATADGADYSNGVLGVRVLNELVQPDGVTNIDIAVFASAGEDFEVVNPTFTSTLSTFLPAGESIEMVGEEEDAPTQPESNVHVIGDPQQEICCKSLTFFGERVGSLRQLTKRYTVYRGLYTTTNKPGIMAWKFSLFPYFRKTTGGGPDTIGAGTGYEYATHPIHWVAAAHAGWRGGMRYKLVWHNNIVATAGVIRNQGDDTAPSFNGAAYSLVGTDAGVTQVMLGYYSNCGSGLAMTNSNMKVLEFEVPFANRYRFAPVDFSDPNNGKVYRPMGNAFRLFMESAIGIDLATAEKITAAVYLAAAEDFNVFGFIGAPVYYVP